jgi:uncharacterized coiled-coil protein SlyX
MTHYKNGVILAMVLLGLVSLITFAQADLVALGKPDKPVKPPCAEYLAQIAELEQIIADQQASIAEQEATIIALQEQIATLNASLTYALPKTGQTNQQDIAGIPITCDDGYLQKGIA